MSGLLLSARGLMLLSAALHKLQEEEGTLDNSCILGRHNGCTLVHHRIIESPKYKGTHEAPHRTIQKSDHMSEHCTDAS